MLSSVFILLLNICCTLEWLVLTFYPLKWSLPVFLLLIPFLYVVLYLFWLHTSIFILFFWLFHLFYSVLSFLSTEFCMCHNTPLQVTERFTTVCFCFPQSFVLSFINSAYRPYKLQNRFLFTCFKIVDFISKD